LSGNDTTVAQGGVQQLKVRLLEKRLSRAFGVGAVGDDDVELVDVVLQEFEAVGNVDGDVGVFESDGHAAEVLLGETDDGLRNF